MTKFETIGVQIQEEAMTKAEANSSFRYSCSCCCNRGMKLDCERCAIRYAHEQIIAILDDQEKFSKKNGQHSNGKKDRDRTGLTERQ